ncbi:MAG: hypothetical protein JSS86_03145 [Cyanobacteria bacterium SZAS LIN-2]|nr:hypothetical protein [Cyanobacteria bacterium SZAS LIN-3]MBS1995274.1 hypothetical protein [Cyanobacteria bacterium SZAS LIN-2]MBS2007840.1 hypothetical protein [Cyanobacteria bacterium SZAS TMP-1]
MAEAKRVPDELPESNLGLEGFDQFFSEFAAGQQGATANGDQYMQVQVEKLLERFTELMSLSVDQRVETGKIANQLIENQRQLVATQQILIKLMERSIELTRHITTIEEKLPTLYELPRVVESLRQRLAEIEGVETH